jgi:hypothetical protein
LILRTDENAYVTFEMIEDAFPSYLRSHFSLTALKRQKMNYVAYLPFFRGPQHHAPAYWRVADLITWLPCRFPPLPLRAFEDFAANLRRLALREPPLTPTRKSAAGYPAGRHRARK